MESTIKKSNISERINMLLTGLLVLAIMMLVLTGYTGKEKCRGWCEKELIEAQILKGDEVYTCEVNWDLVFAEEQDYLQNKSLAQIVQNISNENE